MNRVAEPLREADTSTATPEPVWSAVLGALPGVYVVLNPEYVVSYVSPRVEAAWGYPPSELIGRPTVELFGTEQLPLVWRGRAAAAAGQPASAVLRVRLADGSRRWVECHWSMIPDPFDGPGVVTLAQLRDVEAQVELELRLTRADEQYRTLLRTMSEAALVVDATLRIESVNDQALKLLGSQHDQLIGRPLFAALELRDEDGQPVTAASSEQLLSTEHVGILERWQSIRLGDGSRVPLRLGMASFGRGRNLAGGFVVTLERVPRPDLARAPTDLDRRAIQATAGLTPREGDVLELLARGATVVDIAEERRLSQHSVRGHVKRLLVKLGVHTQLQAVIVAARSGMVDISRQAGEALPDRELPPV